jgi:hypothetical protein
MTNILVIKIKDHFAISLDLRIGAILILLKKTFVAQEIKELIAKTIRMGGTSLSMGIQ